MVYKMRFPNGGRRINIGVNRETVELNLNGDVV